MKCGGRNGGFWPDVQKMTPLPVPVNDWRNWLREMKSHDLEHMLTHIGREGAHYDCDTVRATLAAWWPRMGLCAPGLLGLGRKGGKEGDSRDRAR